LIEGVSASLDAYWSTEFPAVYGAPYKPILETIGYHSVADAPICDGNRLRLGNAYYCASADYIAWDEPGLMLPFYRDVGDFAVAFVLAHEWGHAIASHASANLPETIFGELQADCFAGAYAEWAKSYGILDPGDLDEAVMAMYAVRDPVGTPWLDPNAHGSALDRIRSFSAGMDGGAATCANYSLPEPSGLPPPG
jgi:predicted metalloprotease